MAIFVFKMMLKHFDITITGKVQMVSFRANVKNIATDLGLLGFVKNEKNGTVYVEVEGHQDTLVKFVAWCKIGPSRAVVKEVNVQPNEIKHFVDFKIIR